MGQEEKHESPNAVLSNKFQENFLNSLELNVMTILLTGYEYYKTAYYF